MGALGDLKLSYHRRTYTSKRLPAMAMDSMQRSEFQDFSAKQDIVKGRAPAVEALLARDSVRMLHAGETPLSESGAHYKSWTFAEQAASSNPAVFNGWHSHAQSSLRFNLPKTSLTRINMHVGDYTHQSNIK